ncbi:hypothetical protein [Flaviflexus massiliensis]|uniref:hypothetical protein n=1 Tax=Flaviflexus massiliensis TaxID=1522309 RepID=UPI0006D567A1|nr:hypothetical protein [Flaviflexus massiliensis]
MFDPLGLIPDEWKTDVVRVVDGGRDSSGNWVEGITVTVSDCVIAPGTTIEDGRFSDITTSTIRLFAPLDEAAYDPPGGAGWSSGDTVITPETSMIPGRWQVDGKPVRWPAGWEIKLSGEGGRNGSI